MYTSKNNTASALAQVLTSHSDPATILKTLEWFSHSLWCRNMTLLESFVAQHNGIQVLVNLLRPRHFSDDGLDDKEKIYVRLHGTSSHEPHRVIDLWANVISGMAAEVFGRVCHLMPEEVLPLLGLEHSWIVGRLERMLAKGSEMQQYGSLMCLNDILVYGKVRETIIDECHLLSSLIDLVRITVAPSRSHLKGSLFTHLRWRLAAWRGIVNVYTRLLNSPGVDLYAQETIGEACVVRPDWQQFRQSGDIVQSLISILEFTHESLPQPGDQQYATVFSGPGVFASSGMTVADLAPIISSITYLLQRLGSHDTITKTLIMKQDGLTTVMKELGFHFDDKCRAVIGDFLLFMGVGAPMAQMKANALMTGLTSDVPKTVLRTLRIIAHTETLVDCNHLSALVKTPEALTVLFNYARIGQAVNEQMNKPVGDYKIQRHPSRSSTATNPALPWTTLIRSYAMHLIGRLCQYGFQAVIAKLVREQSWFKDVLAVMIKSPVDIERWAAVTACGSISICLSIQLTSSSYDIQVFQDDIIFHAAVKMLANTKSQKEVQWSLFQKPDDLHWKFEAWESCFDVIRFYLIKRKQESADLWCDCKRAGLVPMVFEVLKYVLDVHGQRWEKHHHSSNPKLSHPTHHKTDLQQIEQCYNNDGTLVRMVEKAVTLIHEMVTADKSSRDTVLWPNHINILLSFSSFADINVQRTVSRTRLLLASELKWTVADKLSSSEKSHRSELISFLGNTDINVYEKTLTKVWPLHILKLSVAFAPTHSKCGTIAREDLHILVTKVCGNKVCLKNETRKNQFQCCKQCRNTWYCSRVCAHTDTKLHRQKCATRS